MRQVLQNAAFIKIFFVTISVCRKGFNSQHALIERWRNSLDNKGYGEAVLIDLSKAFDNLNHDF